MAGYTSDPGTNVVGTLVSSLSYILMLVLEKQPWK